MNKTAFVIPVYPPHYPFAYSLLRSYYGHNLQNEADLWFVFTSRKEMQLFTPTPFCSSGSNHKYVIMAENLPVHSGIINRKKFFAIKCLYPFYEYLIILDVESRFVKQVNVQALCDKYFHDKILLGNKAHDPERIVMSCANMFADRKHELDTTLYLWFNQLCIYKSDNIDEFFNIIGYTENLPKLTGHHFDYYIYMFYLMLYQGFVVQDLKIPKYWGALESSLAGRDFALPEATKAKIYGTHYANHELLDNDNLFVLFHQDRP